MSDAILERIAAALETIAKGAGKVAPAAPAGANKTPPAGAGAAGGGKATPAAGNKAAPAGGNKGAAGAGKGTTPPAAAKAPGGKFNSEQVRDIIRKVATNPSLGKQSALDILDQDGGGVTNVTNLKPENFDKVYEACQALLSSEGGNEPDAAVDEFDPTA
jgi:hypothetical protein